MTPVVTSAGSNIQREQSHFKGHRICTLLDCRSRRCDHLKSEAFKILFDGLVFKSIVRLGLPLKAI